MKTKLIFVKKITTLMLKILTDVTQFKSVRDASVQLLVFYFDIKFHFKSDRCQSFINASGQNYTVTSNDIKIVFLCIFFFTTIQPK